MKSEPAGPGLSGSTTEGDCNSLTRPPGSAASLPSLHWWGSQVDRALLRSPSLTACAPEWWATLTGALWRDRTFPRASSGQAHVPACRP